MDERQIGFQFPGGVSFFPPSHCRDQYWAPMMECGQWLSDTLSAGLKWLGREADRSLPFSVRGAPNTGKTIFGLGKPMKFPNP